MYKIKYLAIFLILVIVVFGVSHSKIWQRPNVIFYEPVIYPIEVLSGDVIVLMDGKRHWIENDMRINSIQYFNGGYVVKGVRHVSLWAKLTESW